MRTRNSKQAIDTFSISSCTESNLFASFLLILLRQAIFAGIHFRVVWPYMLRLRCYSIRTKALAPEIVDGVHVVRSRSPLIPRGTYLWPSRAGDLTE